MKSSKLTYISAFAAVLLVSACDDDSSSSTSCGTNEVISGDACVCDSTTNYYGTPGNCELCTGDHKIVKDNACVCDTNFEDDGAGGCKQKSSICGEHEVENAGACACDNANKYYGTAGSCTICDGTGKIIKDNTCVCDETNYEDNGAGGCKLKNSTLTCGEHEVEDAGSCVCNNAIKYYGTTGNCTLCDGTGKIVKANACVCDDTAYEDDGKGGCKEKLKCGEHEVESDGACVCDNSNNYYGEAGSCSLCSGDHMSVLNNVCGCEPGTKDNSGSCACDKNIGYTSADGGACTCNTSKHFIQTAYGCGCDTYKHYVSKKDGDYYKCECDWNNGWTEDADGACMCRSELIKPGVYSETAQGWIFEDGECKCDENNGWVYGKTGSLVNCYCNAEKGFTYDVMKDFPDSCYCDTKKGLVNNGKGECVCNAGKGFSFDKTTGACICDKAGGFVQSGSACVCDASKNLIANSDGDCVCNGGNGFKFDETLNKCVCDTANGFVEKSNKCVCNSELGLKDDGHGNCTCSAKGFYYDDETKKCKKCIGMINNYCIYKTDEGYFTFADDDDYRSIMKFGTWKCDDNESYSIRWKIVDVNTEKKQALLVSYYILAVRPFYTKNYNDTPVPTSWETSKIREWLNGEFYNTAFASADKSLIVNSRIQNYSIEEVSTYANHYKGYQTHLKEPTTDHVFLLNDGQAREYFPTNDSRKAYYLCTRMDDEGKLRSHYWLTRDVVHRVKTSNGSKSDGYKKYQAVAAINSDDGRYFVEDENHLYYEYLLIVHVTDPEGIRPAMWVKYE